MGDLMSVVAQERSMPKALSITGLVVAVLVLLVFGLDLAMEKPFGRPSMAMDVGFVLSAALLAYMSWSTFREQ
jgi:hypothetical protein